MSIIKLAVIGSGFAKLQALGLAEKATAKYAGSSWLKNAAPKVLPKAGISTISGLPAQPVLAKAALKPVVNLPKMTQLPQVTGANPWSVR